MPAACPIGPLDLLNILPRSECAVKSVTLACHFTDCRNLANLAGKRLAATGSAAMPSPLRCVPHGHTATRPHVCRFAGRLFGPRAPLLHIQMMALPWPVICELSCPGLHDSRAWSPLHQIWDRPWAHANTTDVTLSRPPRRQGAPYSGSTLKPLGVSAMAQETVARVAPGVQVSRCPGAQRCPSLCPQALTVRFAHWTMVLKESDQAPLPLHQRNIHMAAICPEF